MRNAGITILFCSHSLYTVTSFCDRAIWLKDGLIENIGNARDVVFAYEEYLRMKESPKGAAKETGMPVTHSKKVAEIKEIRLFSDNKEINGNLPYSSSLSIMIGFEVFESKPVQVGFAIDRRDGLNIFADSMIRNSLDPISQTGSFDVKISIPEIQLLEGYYRVIIFLLDDTGICVYDQKRTDEFVIETKDKEWGICYIPHHWEIKPNVT